MIDIQTNDQTSAASRPFGIEAPYVHIRLDREQMQRQVAVLPRHLLVVMEADNASGETHARNNGSAVVAALTPEGCSVHWIDPLALPDQLHYESSPRDLLVELSTFVDSIEQGMSVDASAESRRMAEAIAARRSTSKNEDAAEIGNWAHRLASMLSHDSR
jgi:hypothetical protein